MAAEAVVHDDLASICYPSSAIERGVNVRTKNQAGLTMLHYAVLKNDVDSFEKIVAMDPSLLDEADLMGNTPRMLAMSGGSLDMKFKVAAIPVKGKEAKKTRVPLHAEFANAGVGSNFDTVEGHRSKLYGIDLQLDSTVGCAVTELSQNNELHIAALVRDTNQMKKLMANDPDLLGKKNKDGMTPEMVAYVLGYDLVDLGMVMSDEEKFQASLIQMKKIDKIQVEEARMYAIRLFNQGYNVLVQDCGEQCGVYTWFNGKK